MPKYTKKTFEETAKILAIANKEQQPLFFVALNLAAMFKRDNPRFKPELFLKTSGFYKNKKIKEMEKCQKSKLMKS